MADLTQATIEKLNYYVYLLKDPTTHEVFYVGKGKGNRITSHNLEALVYGEKRSEKLEKIRAITGSNREVELVVLRHGLTEKEAFEVEAAVIDLLDGTLTNIMGGHNSDERGMMSLKDIELKYQAEPAVFRHSAALITINRYYYPSIEAEELYDRTRRAWKMSMVNARRVEIACAVYRGIVREVYIPESWHIYPESTDRIYFEGRVAEEPVRSLYIDTSVKHLIKAGSSNPIRYVWAEK
jgi:hypothetical protein